MASSADDTRSPDRPPRVWHLVLGGTLLVLAAILVAQYFNLGPKLSLDFGGRRIQGSAQRLHDSVYVLRFQDPMGDIHRKRYRGSFGYQRSHKDKFDVTITYDPQDSTKFQPAGVSYFPGLISGALFLAGMTAVLRARQLVRARIRRR